MTDEDTKLISALIDAKLASFRDDFKALQADIDKDVTAHLTSGLKSLEDAAARLINAKADALTARLIDLESINVPSLQKEIDALSSNVASFKLTVQDDLNLMAMRASHQIEKAVMGVTQAHVARLMRKVNDEQANSDP